MDLTSFVNLLSEFLFWGPIVGIIGIVSYFGWLILSPFDRIRCLRYGHIPTAGVRAVWKKCPTCGNEEFDHWEKNGNFYCARCGANHLDPKVCKIDHWGRDLTKEPHFGL